MATVAQAVEEVVKSDLRIHDAVRMGITNNRRLAKVIQKDVNKLAKQNTSIGTITVTLSRLASRIREDEDMKYDAIFGKSKLQMRDDITIIYLRGNPDVGEPRRGEAGFFVKIQGIGTTTLLVDDESAESLKYNNEDVLKRITNLSAITITSPDDIVRTPGVLAQLMMPLGGNNINLVEVTSSYDNTFLIVDKKDSLKAVEAVRNLISKARR